MAADYQAALLELDPKRLFERVTAAETAIFNRLQAMSHNSDGLAERQAMMPPTLVNLLTAGAAHDSLLR